jgi:hypothetical protein
VSRPAHSSANIRLHSRKPIAGHPALSPPSQAAVQSAMHTPHTQPRQPCPALPAHLALPTQPLSTQPRTHLAPVVHDPGESPLRLPRLHPRDRLLGAHPKLRRQLIQAHGLATPDVVDEPGLQRLQQAQRWRGSKPASEKGLAGCRLTHSGSLACWHEMCQCRARPPARPSSSSSRAA